MIHRMEVPPDTEKAPNPNGNPPRAPAPNVEIYTHGKYADVVTPAGAPPEPQDAVFGAAMESGFSAEIRSIAHRRPFTESRFADWAVALLFEPIVERRGILQNPIYSL